MLAGSIAITAIAGIVLGLAAGALGVIVQGIVVSEVAHAALAEKLTLGGLWQRGQARRVAAHRLRVPARARGAASASRVVALAHLRHRRRGAAARRSSSTILLVLAAIPLRVVAVDEAPAHARGRSSSSTRPSARRSRARGR